MQYGNFQNGFYPLYFWRVYVASDMLLTYHTCVIEMHILYLLNFRLWTLKCIFIEKNSSIQEIDLLFFGSFANGHYHSWYCHSAEMKISYHWRNANRTDEGISKLSTILEWRILLDSIVEEFLFDVSKTTIILSILSVILWLLWKWYF